MQPIPRLSANLLVILVKISANVLVKLSKLGQGGCHRGPGPGNALGRGSCAWYPRLSLGARPRPPRGACQAYPVVATNSAVSVPTRSYSYLYRFSPILTRLVLQDYYSTRIFLQEWDFLGRIFYYYYSVPLVVHIAFSGLAQNVVRFCFLSVLLLDAGDLSSNLIIRFGSQAFESRQVCKLCYLQRKHFKYRSNRPSDVE